MLGVILTLLVVLATLGIAFSDGTADHDTKSKDRVIAQSPKKPAPK